MHGFIVCNSKTTAYTGLMYEVDYNSRTSCEQVFRLSLGIGRGRRVMHDGMPYRRIEGQGQGHEPFKV